jgi:anti-anti-sigma factor
MSELKVEHFDEVPVVRAPADIDAANSTKVRDELTACTTEGGFELIVDLSNTRYLDSAGIDMLFRLSQSLSQRRASLRIVIPAASDLVRLVEIVGLPSTIPVYADVNAALEAASGSRPAERISDQ